MSEGKSSANSSFEISSTDKSRFKRSRRKQRQRVLGATLVFGLSTISCGFGLLVVAWFFAEQILNNRRNKPRYDLRIKGVASDSVTIERSSNTERRGIYGLDWPGGHAIVGEIQASDATSVTRRLLQTTRTLSAGQRVNWNVHTYEENPERAHGLSYTEVMVPGKLGLYPAWFVPGQLRTWVIMAHGYKATREEGLRIMPLLARLGLPILDLTYRNDPGAPASPDGFHHLGDTEWQDFEAGVQYALEHGAERVVVYGWSMGGNIVKSFLHRSSYISSVQAVILDAPVLDWRLVLDKQARDRHFPEFLTNIVETIMHMRAGINFSALDHINSATNLTTPTLLFHGIDDSLVPVASSDAFASTRPELVTYLRVAGANHTQEWNVDAQAYENALEAFLERTGCLIAEDVLEA